MSAPSAPRTRPSIAARTPERKPRWFLGSFWALVTVALVYAGIVGPGKWLLLLALVTGGYAVYLYRGGRYGFFIF